MGLLTEPYRFDPRLNEEDWDGRSQRGKGCKPVLLVGGLVRCGILLTGVIGL